MIQCAAKAENNLSTSVLTKLQYVHESSRDGVMDVLASGPESCISKKLPGVAIVAGSLTTLE